MLSRRKRFGEDISGINGTGDVSDGNLSELNGASNEVIFSVDMFGTVEVNVVLDKGFGGLIIEIEGSRVLNETGDIETIFEVMEGDGGSR